MRLLLDTHVFLWSVADSPELPKKAKDAIRDADEVFVSAASLWEISIKVGLGKLKANPQEFVRAISASGFTELPITALHAAQVETLPEHHKDPFDRLLVAQALTEPMHLLTADAQLKVYTDLVIHI